MGGIVCLIVEERIRIECGAKWNCIDEREERKPGSPHCLDDLPDLCTENLPGCTHYHELWK